MRYPIVFFDAGETLLGPRESFGATYARVLAQQDLELPPAALETAMRESWAEISRAIPAGTDRYRHFEDGERGYWLRLARQTIERAAGRPVSARSTNAEVTGLREAFLDRQAWTVYPDVLPALQELRDMGARLAIVSNWDSRLPQVLALLDLTRHFEGVTFSHQEGIEKPHPEIFHRALQRMGGRPGETLHVGDLHEMDVVGANAAGIDALLIQRGGCVAGRPSVIASFAELPRIVNQGFSA